MHSIPGMRFGSLSRGSDVFSQTAKFSKAIQDTKTIKGLVKLWMAVNDLSLNSSSNINTKLRAIQTQIAEKIAFLGQRDPESLKESQIALQNIGEVAGRVLGRQGGESKSASVSPLNSPISQEKKSDSSAAASISVDDDNFDPNNSLFVSTQSLQLALTNVEKDIAKIATALSLNSNPRAFLRGYADALNQHKKLLSAAIDFIGQRKIPLSQKLSGELISNYNYLKSFKRCFLINKYVVTLTKREASLESALRDIKKQNTEASSTAAAGGDSKSNPLPTGAIDEELGLIRLSRENLIKQRGLLETFIQDPSSLGAEKFQEIADDLKRSSIKNNGNSLNSRDGLTLDDKTQVQTLINLLVKGKSHEKLEFNLTLAPGIRNRAIKNPDGSSSSVDFATDFIRGVSLDGDRQKGNFEAFYQKILNHLDGDDFKVKAIMQLMYQASLADVAELPNVLAIDFPSKFPYMNTQVARNCLVVDSAFLETQSVSAEENARRYQTIDDLTSYNLKLKPEGEVQLEATFHFRLMSMVDGTWSSEMTKVVVTYLNPFNTDPLAVDAKLTIHGRVPLPEAPSGQQWQL